MHSFYLATSSFFEVAVSTTRSNNRLEQSQLVHARTLTAKGVVRGQWRQPHTDYPSTSHFVYDIDTNYAVPLSRTLYRSGFERLGNGVLLLKLYARQGARADAARIRLWHLPRPHTGCVFGIFRLSQKKELAKKNAHMDG